MQIINRVIQLARERALVKFSALARNMLHDTQNNLVEELANDKSQLDHRKVSLALHYLRKDQALLCSRMEKLFQVNLNRAMKTMYVDLRLGLGGMSADNLTLLDDDTLNRQMEVNRLVLRLRTACDENLGRLNLMIAQLHDQHEVQERENPFRPYLMARTLHDVLQNQTLDEVAAALLFEQLADAMAKHLPKYYADICDVFKSSGIQARLLARPSRNNRGQPEQEGASSQTDGRLLNAIEAANDFNSRIMPSMQRMLDLMQKAPVNATAGANEGDAADRRKSSTSFQDFVWKIFNHSKSMESAADATMDGSGPPSEVTENVLAPASSALISHLNQFQQMAARGESVNNQISPDQNQLFSLRDQIGAKDASPRELVAIDVVAMLFEFILEDEQIPAGLRVQICRLQIPFLKAAMLSPEMLQHESHPARQLLNRMSSTAIGMGSESAIAEKFANEITRISKNILDKFDKDISVFGDSLKELEQFLAQNLRNTDTATALSVEAIEKAEKTSVVLFNTADSLRAILTPLNVDQRVSDFITQIWVRVLVRASAQAIEGNETPENINAMSKQYLDVLSELVWSAQEKQNPAERNALMRLLPGLVKRLKIGLVMIKMPPEESQNALDQLVTVHKQILGAAQFSTNQNLPSLEALREQFSRLVIDKNSAEWVQTNPPQIEPAAIQTALAERGVSASLDMERNSNFSVESDTDWLEQMQLGTCVEHLMGDSYYPARMIWISQHRSVYIFKLEINSKPLVYSSISLVKALREGALRTLEYAPVFDRAVDSMMFGAESIEPTRHGAGAS